MKQLKIIEGWNEHKPETEKVCELGICGHRNSFNSQMIDDLLKQQSELTRQETIKECKSKLPLEQSSPNDTDYRRGYVDGIVAVHSELQKLLNQPNQ